MVAREPQRRHQSEAEGRDRQGPAHGVRNSVFLLALHVAQAILLCVYLSPEVREKRRGLHSQVCVNGNRYRAGKVTGDDCADHLLLRRREPLVGGDISLKLPGRFGLALPGTVDELFERCVCVPPGCAESLDVRLVPGHEVARDHYPFVVGAADRLLI